jgi:hypothetical protein
MAYELKPGSGTLFENTRKVSDTHPDLTGSINVNGTEHWFSGWWKDGKNGQFLSVSIGKVKEQQQRQQASAPAPSRPALCPGQRPAAAAPARKPASFDDGDDMGDVPF